jgi:hypothetical protein
VSWSTTQVKYRWPLRKAISSIPVRRSPANRSTRPDASATTRVTIEPTDRQVTRSNSATTDPGACAASQAQVSSKSLVNRDRARAQGTAATTTPCTRHDSVWDLTLSQRQEPRPGTACAHPPSAPPAAGDHPCRLCPFRTSCRAGVRRHQRHQRPRPVTDHRARLGPPGCRPSWARRWRCAGTHWLRRSRVLRGGPSGGGSCGRR